MKEEKDDEVEKNKKKQERIKIVKGNSKNLKFSDVKDNLIFEVHDSTKKNIVIPDNQKDEQ